MAAKKCEQGKCFYSRGMNQPVPRRCIKCGYSKPEIGEGGVIPAPTKPDNVPILITPIKTDLSASGTSAPNKKEQKIINFTDISKRKAGYLVELLDEHGELYLMIPSALPIKIAYAKMI